MKIAGKTGISFGFSAVNAGQRGTTQEPQVIAVSTEGNFRITAAVSKVLGIGHGENIMFLSNIDQINIAIAEKNEGIVAFCEEAGLELGSPEAAIAIHAEFDEWGIAKGIAEFDPKGNARTGTERLTKNDKSRFVSQNFDAMLEGALESDDEDTKSALTRDGITKEEQMDILSKFVQPKEVQKFKGSKSANPGGTTGAGVSLTFTDSNVWNQLKADLGDTATNVNRVFDVDVEDLKSVTLSDGYKEVTINVLTLTNPIDKEPARIGSAEKAEEAVED